MLLTKKILIIVTILVTYSCSSDSGVIDDRDAPNLEESSDTEPNSDDAIVVKDETGDKKGSEEETTNEETPVKEAEEPREEENPAVFALTYDQFVQCKNEMGLERAIQCFDNYNFPKGELTQAMIDRCVMAVGSHSVSVSMCLAKQGFGPKQHRDPLQMDIDTCLEKAQSISGIAGCLDKQGILPADLDQTKIEQCLVNVPVNDLGKCLAKKKYTSRKLALMQSDIFECKRTLIWYGKTGTDDEILTCLRNQSLIPDSAELRVSSCLSNPMVGIDKLSYCLRKNNELGPNVISNHEVGRCLKASGGDKALVGNCLASNYLLPWKWQKEESQENIAVASGTIASCFEAVGENRVVKCLRINGHLEKLIYQPHINKCAQLAGEDAIYNCLSGHFDLPATINADMIGSCQKAVGTDSIGMCLRKKVYSRAAIKPDSMFCEGAVGEENVSKCLIAHGLYSRSSLLHGEVIKACSLQVSTDRIAACLQANEVELPKKITDEAFTLSASDLTKCINDNSPSTALKCLANLEFTPTKPTFEYYSECSRYHDHNAEMISICLEENGMKDTVTKEKIEACDARTTLSGAAAVKVIHECLYPFVSVNE